MSFMWNLRQMRESFPIKVYLYKRYRNRLVPEITRGRYYKERIKTEQGALEHQYIVLRQGFMKYKKIPYVPQEFYYDEEGKQSIYLLAINKDVYYPLTFVDGSLLVNADVPTETEVINEQGEKEIIRGTERKQVALMDTKISLNKDTLISVPYAISNQTYSNLTWLNQEAKSDLAIYTKSNVFSKYKDIITLAIIAIVCIIAIITVTNNISQSGSAVITAQQGYVDRLARMEDAQLNNTQAIMNLTKILIEKG